MQLAILQIKSYENRCEDIYNALRSIQAKLMINPECLKCDVYFTSNKEQKVIYMEIWQSKKALRTHVRSELYRDILSIMELAVETPEIQFHTLTETRGMELITETRQSIKMTGASRYE
jgi:quinol monooxygenase YgiN